jgi:hypothetical protein
MCSGNAVFLRSVMALVDVPFETVAALYATVTQNQRSGDEAHVLKAEHLLKLIERQASLNNNKEAKEFLRRYFKEQQQQGVGDGNGSALKKSGGGFFARLKAAIKS